MDWPSKFLGPNHRKLNHSVIASILIGFLASKDPKGAMAGLLHVATDEAVTFVKKEVKKIAKRGRRNKK